MNDEGWRQALSRERQDAGYEVEWGSGDAQLGRPG